MKKFDKDEKYKRKAYRFVNKNSKFTKIIQTIDYDEIGKTCLKDLKNYEITKEINLKEYNKLKQNSTEFLTTYMNLKKKKKEEMKKMNDAMNPFFDLINEYIQRGYKQPNLTSENKNIFKRSLLIEHPKYYKEYFEINKLSKKEINELNFLQRFKKNINVIQDLKNNIKKNDKAKTIDSENNSNNKNEFIDLLNKEKIKDLPSIPVEKKIKEKEEEDKEKERNELTAYNTFVKNVINSVEKDYLKTKVNLNKAGFIFPSSTQAKNKIKIKFGLSPNKKSNDSKEINNTSYTSSKSFFHPHQSSINVGTILKKKIYQKYKNKYMNVKKPKIKRSSLPILHDINSMNLTSSTNYNEHTINSISNSLAEPTGEINDFLKVIAKTKRRLLDYDTDNIRRIILNHHVNDNKGKMIIEKLNKLDHKIMTLDKELIKALEKNKSDN